MSTLDMNSGYFQFLITEKDQHKTAFLTKLGLFEFRGLAISLQCTHNIPESHATYLLGDDLEGNPVIPR